MNNTTRERNCKNSHNECLTCDINDIEIPDVTLASCCEREERERARIDNLKAVLSKFDPAKQRIDIYKNAVCRGSIDKHEIEEMSFESSIGEDEEDSVVSDFMKKRMEELLQGREAMKATETSGFGVAVQVDESTLLERIHAHNQQQSVVCVVDPSFDRSSDLCEYFSAIASRHRDWPFYLCFPQSRYFITDFGFEADQTGICILIGATVIRRVRVQDNDTWIEQDVQDSICGLPHGPKEMTLGDDSTTTFESDEREPCDVCGRRYFHTHVKQDIPEY